MPRARARALVGLAQALAGGDLVLDPGSNPDEVSARLLALPGVGPWTAGYVRLRGLGDPTCSCPPTWACVAPSNAWPAAGRRVSTAAAGARGVLRPAPPVGVGPQIEPVTENAPREALLRHRFDLSAWARSSMAATTSRAWSPSSASGRLRWTRSPRSAWATAAAPKRRATSISMPISTP